MKQLFEGRQRFSIRKFSFGAASVLLGTVFLAQAPLAHAEEIGNPSGDKLVKDVTAKSDSEESKSVDAATQPETSVTKEDKALAETPAEVVAPPSVEATIEKEEMQAPSSAPATEEKTALPKAETPAKTPVSPAQAEEKKVSDQTVARLTEAVKDLEEHQAKAAESEKVQEHLANAKQALQNPQVSSAELKDVLAKTSTIRNRVVNASLRATSGARDSRNGQAMAPVPGVTFRANTVVGEAVEGPTSHNKLGYKNNPANGVFNNTKDQFGDIDFTTSDVENKFKKLDNQWSGHSNFVGGEGSVELGKITYNWKEKKITKDAAEKGALNGWKIEGNQGYVMAIKPEEPTELSDTRPEKYKPIPGKVYDNDGTIDRKYETTNVGAGVNNAAQNYANGLDMKSVGRVDGFSKGYYLELGKQGNKIFKEFDVNSNSRLFLNIVTGGAYGPAGTASAGEKIKITLLDADTNKEIPSIKDDLGGGNEASHVSSPDVHVWSHYRAIYNTFNTTKRVKLVLEALEDGTAFNSSYTSKGKQQIEDGYLVASVNMSVGSGTESITNVKSNNRGDNFGENHLYKQAQQGTFEFTVNNVGGNTHYGSAISEIIVPEGVELPEYLKDTSKWTGNPKDWIPMGGLYINKNNISYDASTRKLTLKYNTSKGNNGPNPFIGPGSNNGVRSLSIPFMTADDYKGTAIFKLRTYLPNGFEDADTNNVLISNDLVGGGRYSTPVSGVLNSDNPDYYYNKVIYIDTKKPTVVAAEAVHTDHIIGDGKAQNQAKRILVTPPTEDGLTSSEKEQANIAELNKLNGTSTTVEKIEEALGGVKSMTVTLPNGASAITLEKKADGWYQGAKKLEEKDGKLVLPLPENVNLDEANETTNPEKRIKITAMDKAGNISDPAYVNIINNAPEIKVAKKDIYMYKTKANLTSDDVVAKTEATSTDLEDDRDGVEGTKPAITANTSQYNTTTPGTYNVTLTATDSDGKTATTNATIHVYDLITVDPTVTNDPTDPSTTAPVSPKEPDSMVKDGDETRGKYPSGVTMDDLVKEVTRTINYVKKSDHEARLKDSKIEKVTFKRTATVNPDTKEVTYSDWSVYEGEKRLENATPTGEFNAVDSPVVKGYLLDDVAQKTILKEAAPKPVNDQEATTQDTEVNVAYRALGSFIPTYPEGKKPTNAPDKIVYPNHATDPYMTGDFSTITIPYVPGYTPVINGVELTLKTPNDPRDGYVPSDPSDNFADTPVAYTPSMQKVTVAIRTKDGENEQEHFVQQFVITGRAGDNIPKDNAEVLAKVAELEGQGYKVTTNEYANAGTFDFEDDIVPKSREDATQEGAEGQLFSIVLTARTETVTPDAPKDKDGLVDGDKHPNLKWPEGVAKDNLNKDVTRTISFVKKDTPTSNEEKAKDDVVQPVHFKRSAEVNLVTKKVTYKDWMSEDKNLPAVKVDVLKGYLADKKEVPVAEATTPTKDGDVTLLTEKVTYTKIGTWIPVKPGGSSEPIPYPNDPDDPTKPGKITEIIPYVPGYTPKDKDGQPLKEKNPGHPEEGYIPPKITNPNENITINYEKDDQKAKVQFVSVDSKTKEETELTSEMLTLTGKTDEAIDAAKVTEKLAELDKHGYDQTENPFATPQTFDDKKDEADKPSQVFVVKVTPRVSTVEVVYVVEGEVPTVAEVNAGVRPADKGMLIPLTAEEVAKVIPTTEGKAGQTLEIPAKVTYGEDANKRTEEVKVPVVVLPKAKAEGLVVPKGTGEVVLKEAIKEKAKEAIAKLTKLPEGVTAKVPEDDAIMAPVTSEAGDKGEVEVTVNYTASNGKLLVSSSVKVPVTVFESKATPLVVFEGDEITADMAKKSISQTHGGEVQTPADLPLTDGKAGAADVKINTTIKHKVGGKEVAENVEVPVTVLPLPKPELVIVAKDSDKDALREKAKAKAKKAIENGDFKAKLPQGATVELDATKEINIPDLTDDTEVYVPLVYTVDGKKYTTEAEVPVEIVEGYPQYVPANDENTQPDAEKSIDKGDYSEGSTFKYKESVNTKEAGLKDVVVVVTNNGETLAEVPAKVAVVESTPRYIAQTETNEKLQNPENSIAKEEYPDGATFEYSGDVDTTKLGEQKVNVVVKTKDGEPIVTVPASVTVVSGYDKYVPVNGKTTAEEQVDPDDYPLDSTFEYKTPVDTSKVGVVDTFVVVKDENGMTLVEVPVSVIVVEGHPQYVPANDENKQPSPKDSIDEEDYPENSTFKYKEPVDTTEAGLKDVEVVVEKDGEIIAGVPAKVAVVESTPRYIVQTETKEKLSSPEKSITPEEYPDGATFEYDGDVDTTTLGEQKVNVVVKTKDGQPIVTVPATVTVVAGTDKYVPVSKENLQPNPKEQITPDDYPLDATYEYKDPIDTTTKGNKGATVVVKDENGKVLVEVPVTVKVVEGKTVTVPANDKETPKPEENIVPGDYPNGATFEYKTPVDITTVGEKDVVVVVKDKDGKVLVEVPGKVLVVDGMVTPIETPVTTTPLEASDLEKYVKVPEGGNITKVGEIPSFTTPGTKPEIEVEITLENGKKIVKKVPVTVTPVSPIETPVTTTPLTKEDVSKHIKIPEGGSIISIGEIPGVDMPGQKKPIRVVVELPGGKRITVEVPVTVTPVHDIETPVTTTPLTPEDISKQIQIPEGGKVISVGKVPGVDTAGDKGRVTVVVELPDGKRVEIPVHVNVTPITPIQVPQGTPITETDVQKHVKIPEGGKIISIGDIPTTETAGHKPSVPIVIELPGGKQIRVEVPVDVTPITQVPTDSPIQPALPEIAFADGEELVVPQYSAIGEQDILKRVHVPAGGKVIQMTALPSTETPGRKPAVEVIVELSEGHLLRVLVPVLVTPVQQEHVELEMPKKPTASAEQSAKSAVSAMASEQQVKKELPNTGSTSSILSTLGLFGFLSGFGLALKSRKDEE